MSKLTFTFIVLLIVTTTCFAQEHSSPSKDPVPKVSPPVTAPVTAPVSRPVSSPINNWINYNSAEGRYSVRFPGEPKLSSQETTNSAGLKLSQYMATSGNSQLFCQVGYFDFPAGFDFAKARDGIVERLKGTLLGETTITLQGHSGRELRISAKEPDGTEYLVRARIYAVQSRAYFVQFITARSNTDASLAEIGTRYLDSFSVSVP
jgi:hypothetical protein